VADPRAPGPGSAPVQTLSFQRMFSETNDGGHRSVETPAPQPRPTRARALAAADAAQTLSSLAGATVSSSGEVTWAAPPVQRAPDEGPTEPAGDTMQAPESAPAAAGETTAGGASDAATDQGAPSPEALEELARRLYDPLCARLRAEFWLDRERAGLVTERRW
jgi:hypothetical protein